MNKTKKEIYTREMFEFQMSSIVLMVQDLMKQQNSKIDLFIKYNSPFKRKQRVRVKATGKIFRIDDITMTNFSDGWQIRYSIDNPSGSYREYNQDELQNVLKKRKD
jgi:hypothetical protein